MTKNTERKRNLFTFYWFVRNENMMMVTITIQYSITMRSERKGDYDN